MAKIIDLFDKKNNPSIIKEWIEDNLESNYIDVGDLFEFVDIINGNDYDENVLWHYTKMNVLEKILQKDKVEIRFTNTNDSNDPLEALVYKPFLIKNQEKILENLKTFELYEDLKKDFEELIEKKRK